MKISQNFNIQRETLLEAPNWIDRLLGPLNLTIQQILQALQTNLTFEDNVVGQIRQFKVTTGPNYVANKEFTTIIVPWLFANKKRPQAVLVGQIVQPSNQLPTYQAVIAAGWLYDGTGAIRIPFLTGLADNSTYDITFVIL
jgi:hypothetical protein